MANLFKITKLLLMLGICTYLTRWYFHRRVNLEPYRKDGWFGGKALKGIFIYDKFFFDFFD